MGKTATRYACRNCRRPLCRAAGSGWLHGELPQYADEPIVYRLVGHGRTYAEADGGER